jgi:hypothetical protein
MKRIFRSKIGTLYIAIVLSSFTGCSVGKPFQPPPPMYQSYTKDGATASDVKSVMRQCGYAHEFGGNPGDTSEEVARRENCMFRNGFKYRDGYEGICSFKESSRLDACKNN